MPKQIQMWEAADGELFDCEEDAIVHDSLEKLRSMRVCGLTDSEIELIERIIEDEEFRKAFTEYTIAKHNANLAEQKRNEQPKDIKKVLANASNSSS